MEPKYITSESQVTIERLYILPRTPTPGIKGVQSRDVVVMGETVRGPVDTLVEITSGGRFLEVFGGRDYGSGGALKSPVWAALVNKKFGRLWVVRAADLGGTGALSTIMLTAAGPTNIVRADAANIGAWSAGLVSVVVGAASNGDANSWKATVNYLGKSQVFDNLLTTTGNDNLASVLGSDLANWITLTKVADGRPVNGTYVLVSGSDGSIVDADFTAAGRTLDVGFGKRKGVCAFFVAGRSNSAIKTALKTKAATVNGGFVLMTSDAANTADATLDADALANQAGPGRVIYCSNWPNVQDPQTAGLISVDPLGHMASILSQIDAEAHPGDVDAKQYTADIKSLAKSPDETTMDTYRTSGVASLVEDDGGFVFQSGVTTDRLEIADIRAADYLNQAIGDALKTDVKKPNTIARRRSQVARIVDFLDGEKKAQHLVEDFYVDGEALDTPLSRGQNKRQILVRGRLISHMNFFIIQTEFGTQVVLDRSSAS